MVGVPLVMAFRKWNLLPGKLLPSETLWLRVGLNNRCSPLALSMLPTCRNQLAVTLYFEQCKDAKWIRSRLAAR